MLETKYLHSETFTALDGRNKFKLKKLIPAISDLAIYKQKLKVEIKYLILLSDIKVAPRINSKTKKTLESIYKNFDNEDYHEIRTIELEVNHDIKSIEIFIQRKLNEHTETEKLSPFVHYCLTSDDINNISYNLAFSEFNNVFMEEVETFLDGITKFSTEFANAPMLGRTHGQGALPTTFGKEMLIYKKRAEEYIAKLKNLRLAGKVSGNVGNFHSHYLLHPDIDWITEMKKFVEGMGLDHSPVTSQTLPYDSLVDYLSTLKRFNEVLIGLCVDLWTYAMLGYLSNKVLKKEVGSTALPHKVNPIYLEGAEGGFEIANSLLGMYERKLLKTRLQRDLSDSTVRRSIPLALGYIYLSLQSLNVAFERLTINREAMFSELTSRWEVLSEPVQNYLRNKGFHEAYNLTKQFFRGHKITADQYMEFVSNLPLERDEKAFLLNLKPENYLGIAEELVNDYI